MHGSQHQAVNGEPDDESFLVLWISGCPVAKYDPTPGRAIQHDPLSRPMGDPTLDK